MKVVNLIPPSQNLVVPVAITSDTPKPKRSKSKGILDFTDPTIAEECLSPYSADTFEDYFSRQRQTLAREYRVYDELSDEDRKIHYGQWVAIQGDLLLGYFPSYAESVSAAMGSFSLQEYLVRQVV